MYEDLSLYINGQFLKGEGRREQDIFNPATDEVVEGELLDDSGASSIDAVLEPAI